MHLYKKSKQVHILLKNPQIFFADFRLAESKESHPLHFHHFMHLKHNKVIACSLSPKTTTSLVHVYRTDLESKTLRHEQAIETAGKIFALARCHETSQVVLQMNDGSVYILCPGKITWSLKVIY